MKINIPTIGTREVVRTRLEATLEKIQEQVRRFPIKGRNRMISIRKFAAVEERPTRPPQELRLDIIEWQKVEVQGTTANANEDGSNDN